MTISEIFHIKNTISQPYKVPIKHFLFQNQNKNSIPFQFNFSQFLVIYFEMQKFKIKVQKIKIMVQFIK